LKFCASTTQPGQVPGVLGTVAAAIMRRLPRWRQVRRLVAEGADSPDRVAENAGRGEKNFAPMPQRGRLRLGGGPALAVQPRLETLRVFGDHEEPHVRVLVAAELRAHPRKDARAVGPEDVRRGAGPGRRSFFPWKLGAQKLWITSADESWRRTGRPTGMWISLAVTTVSLGGWPGSGPPTTTGDR
jgi:hypothetical protein